MKQMSGNISWSERPTRLIKRSFLNIDQGSRSLQCFCNQTFLKCGHHYIGLVLVLIFSKIILSGLASSVRIFISMILFIWYSFLHHPRIRASFSPFRCPSLPYSSCFHLIYSIKLNLNSNDY